MPVTNKLLTCAFDGFYTQQLIDFVKFYSIKTFKSSCVEAGSVRMFLDIYSLLKMQTEGIFNAAPEGTLYTTVFYTVL